MARILLFTPESQDEWSKALSEHLPSAQVSVWPEVPVCDYAALWNPPPELFTGQDRLKAIFSLGAGVDGLLSLQSLPKGVPVVKVEDSGMAGQMTEYALYAALHQLRRFQHYAEAQACGLWNPAEMRYRCDLSVGVLGLGSLGSQVASQLADFGFTVRAWSRTSKNLRNVDCTSGEAGLEDVLKNSEVLIVLLPLNSQTSGLLDHDRLALLPQGTCVVNVSRGPIVVEHDLLQLLNSGHISRAFLDVFANEPLAADHPFWSHPRVTVTPHVAAQTPIDPAAAQIAAKILRIERGDPITGVASRVSGY